MHVPDLRWRSDEKHSQSNAKILSNIVITYYAFPDLTWRCQVKLGKIIPLLCDPCWTCNSSHCFSFTCFTSTARFSSTFLTLECEIFSVALINFSVLCVCRVKISHFTAFAFQQYTPPMSTYLHDLMEKNPSLTSDMIRLGRNNGCMKYHYNEKESPGLGISFARKPMINWKYKEVTAKGVRTQW